MALVNTVLGPMDSAQLGCTLAHEHIIVTSAGIAEYFPELLGPELKKRIVDDLLAAKAGGVTTIVDATTHDLGRDPRLLVDVARASGVNIIACAGWWLDIPRALTGFSADALVNVFAREVEEGIGGTGVRPGVLKGASDQAGVTEYEEIVLRAVARAHRRTGLPVIVHSYSPGRVGEKQAAILEEEGVDPGRVCLGHSNDTTDAGYLIGLARRGYFIGMDRYPGMGVEPRERTATLKKLLDAGFASQVLVSHDRSAVSAFGPGSMTEDERRRRNPHGWLYISKVVVPWLREMGTDEATLASLCTDAPRRFFEGP